MRSALVVPLLITAVLGGLAGFLLAEELAPVEAGRTVRVLELPATPRPTPSPTPKATANSRVRIRTGSGSTSGGSCPAGCECDHQPNGIIIRCTGG